jgi:DNA repair exonuclease SbcCD nuclease subunit
VKFLHAADLHFDSPLRGLSAAGDAPLEQIRSAPRAAFQALVRLAHEEDVDFVILAGDVTDGAWKDMGTASFFNAQLKALAPIPVYIKRGNHDAEADLLSKLPALPHVHTFSSKHPQTFHVGGLSVAIHGQSYPKKAVSENLAANYPAPEPGMLNIGVLHTGLAGGYTGHESYAPCTLPQLITHGYDYWALGHIHAREELHADPLIIYPGNLQGRHVGEVGPKGCYIIEGEKGTLRATFHELDVVRWFESSIDVSDADDAKSALGEAFSYIEDLKGKHSGRLIAVRMTLIGSTAAHHELARDAAQLEQDLRDRVAPESWLVALRVHTMPLTDIEAICAQESLQGALFRSIAALKADPEADPILAMELKKLQQKIPHQVRELYQTDLEHPTTLGAALDGAERILLAEMFR